MYATPNKHGAYCPDVCEVITFKGRNSFARIMLANIAQDQWIFSTIVKIASSREWGGYPSDRSKPRPSRDAALWAAFGEISKAITSAILTNSAASLTEIGAGREVLRWLTTFDQPRLF